MRIEPQHYLKLAEMTGDLVTFDIETSNLNADYGSTLIVSMKPYGKKPYSIQIKQVGNDVKVVKEVKAELEKYGCWMTYYGKGFDIPFLNTRLLKWGLDPIEPRHHIDMFYVLKAHTKTSRKSLAQFAGLLDLDDQKIGVSPNTWSEYSYNSKHGREMRTRCEGDCITLEQLYDKTKHIIRDIKRGI